MIVLCCVARTMLNCFYGPSAYLTKNKVVVKLFLRYWRAYPAQNTSLFPPLSYNRLRWLLSTVIDYCRLISTAEWLTQVTHTNTQHTNHNIYKVDVRLKYSMAYTALIFRQLAHSWQLFVKKSYIEFHEIRQKVLSPHNKSFLGASEKLRKTTIRFAMSVRPHRTPFPLDRLS